MLADALAHQYHASSWTPLDAGSTRWYWRRCCSFSYVVTEYLLNPRWGGSWKRKTCSINNICLIWKILLRISINHFSRRYWNRCWRWKNKSNWRLDWRRSPRCLMSWADLLCDLNTSCHVESCSRSEWWFATFAVEVWVDALLIILKSVYFALIHQLKEI